MRSKHCVSTGHGKPKPKQASLGCRAPRCALSITRPQAIGGYKKKPSTKLLKRVHGAMAGGTLEYEIDGESAPQATGPCEASFCVLCAQQCRQGCFQ